MPARLGRWIRSVAPAAFRGTLVGLLGMLLFMAVHAVIIQPIWLRGLVPGAAIAFYGGAIAGVLHARVVRNGWKLGALAAITPLPFLFAGMMCTAGHAPRAWVTALAFLLAALVIAIGLVAGLRALPWVVPGLLVINAMPAIFLTFITEFHDLPVQPVPMTLALAGIYVACGGVLEKWMKKS